VSNDVDVPIVTSYFEVPVTWSKPLVDDLIDLDAAVVEAQCTRRLFPSIARIAVDFDHCIILAPV
jgi:hypothetical protein